MKRNEFNEEDSSAFRDILGYLNFSSGNLEPRFLKAWNRLFFSLEEMGEHPVWEKTLESLEKRRVELAAESEAFRQSDRAAWTLSFIRTKFLPAFRQFHHDLLFHQTEEFLYNPFFLARVCRIILSFETPENKQDEDRILQEGIRQLNDFLGYRPVPVLEGEERHEPNPHEWVAPIPLWREDAGTAFGRYHDLVEKTIEILRDTDPVLLRDAWFDPEKLTELAIDPRAFDFDHPVNRRPNYHFGTWDPHLIDQNGYFRRFIVHQVTLDGILARVETIRRLRPGGLSWQVAPIPVAEGMVLRSPEIPEDQLLYEAAAVLAGTILMGSGITGDHVQTHDSSVTLSTLIPQIASYRDRFYELLIQKIPTAMRPRLEEEARRLFQPFGGARQDLNKRLAKKQADQLQRLHLARLFARMGYFDAAERQSKIIEVASARILCRIDCLITRGYLMADTGDLKSATPILDEMEDLLYRGINCGALPDPWTLLGFGAQFSLFPAADNTVHDHRIDDLIDLLNDMFDLYSRLLKEAAASDQTDLQADFSDRMSDLAGWWDQFGSCDVSSVEGFSGQTVWKSAAMVATALAAWRKGGTGSGDVAFWSRHVERFSSPKAFVLLGEALLDRKDPVASMALLVHWLAEADEIPLTEGSYSFHSITFRWMEDLWNERGGEAKDAKRRQASRKSPVVLSPEEYRRRWSLTKNFLARLEKNAGEYGTVPVLEIDSGLLDKVFRPTESSDDENRRDFDQLVTPVVALMICFQFFARYPELGHSVSGPDDLNYLRLHNGDFRELIQKNIPEERVPDFFLYLCRILQSGPDGVPKWGEGEKAEDKRFAGFFPILLRYFAIPDGDDSASPSDLESLYDFLVSGDDSDEPEKDDEDDPNDPFEMDGFGDEDDLGDDDLFRNNPLLASDGELGEGEDSEADDSSGIDPTFRAAYDDMVFRDSADDGVDDEMMDGGSFLHFPDEDELADETDRINDRLAFIFSLAKLWKFSAGKSPLLAEGQQSEEDLADARKRIAAWMFRTVYYRRALTRLLRATANYRIPTPHGTSESLMEYDQLHGTKEILLDRIIRASVEVNDTSLFLRAVLADRVPGEEDIPGIEANQRPWYQPVLRVLGAILRSNPRMVKRLWGRMLASLETETLLYIPTSRGGDAAAIVNCRCLQQVILRLLEYAPRLGLLTETFRLLRTVQKMEQIRPNRPGAITEFDRIFETATRSVARCLIESSQKWRLRTTMSVYKTSDEALVFYMERAMDLLLGCWLSHSQHIRISSVESILGDTTWEQIKEFVQKYGSDLFTQDFLNFRNLRAILHQGVENWLQSLLRIHADNRELESAELLVDDLAEGRISMAKAAGNLELIFECIAENFTEYIDYNSTTTHSDHGEKLYMLLDMLRVLTQYERIAWNLKPVYWVHDAMIQNGRESAATLWEANIRRKSGAVSDDIIRKYRQLSERYGVWLPSIYERLDERFVLPLQVDRMTGLVPEAIREAEVSSSPSSSTTSASAAGSVSKASEEKEGKTKETVSGAAIPGEAFKKLETQIEQFAERQKGSGFDVPEWLTALEDEVFEIQDLGKEGDRQRDEDAFNPSPVFPPIHLTRAELERQLVWALEHISFNESR